MACSGVAEGERFGPVGDWGARDPKTGGIDGRGIAGGHAERTKTSEKMSGVAGVRDSEGSGRAVVGDGEAKECRGEGVGFGVVESRETRDKKVIQSQSGPYT